jgi:hypothetical protein
MHAREQLHYGYRRNNVLASEYLAEGVVTAPNINWLPPDYDLYVISLKVFDAIFPYAFLSNSFF